MHRFSCSLLCLTTLAIVASTNRVFAESTRRPNVVVILSDDQGWGDLSLHGNPNLQTPNIDAIGS